MQFGDHSNPKPGSHVLFARLGGGSDRVVILGLDDAAVGPRDLRPGERAIFDASGNIISLVQGKIRVVASGDFELVASGAVTIQSASLTHNGKNIGATHVHTAVMSGPANTGVPA